MSLNIKVDDRAVIQALDDLADRDAKRGLQKATKKAATFLAQRARPKAPRRTGKLRKSVTARANRRDKPGSYVTARAPHRHLVQLGTRDRFTRGSGAFRGRMTAQPFIAQTADQYGDEALTVAERELSRLLDL